jgi:hypothetical protein
MTISWDKPYKQKYLSFIWTEYSLIKFRKTPLGWDVHLGKLCITYDNWGKAKNG